jgi:hypothetical protein
MPRRFGCQSNLRGEAKGGGPLVAVIPREDRIQEQPTEQQEVADQTEL